MDAVTKNRSLVSIIIFLLISNITILIFFLCLSDGRKGFHGKEDRNTVSVFLQKEIGFNKQQMDEYQKLRATHMQSVKPLFDDIRSAKESFYNLLYINNVADSTVNKAAAVIGEKQMVLDMQMFSLFKNVRNLCTPQELPKFDSLFKKVVEKMTGGRFIKAGNNKRN
jgi:protein CpxP